MRDPIFFFAVVVHSAFALGRPLLVHLQTVFDGLQLQVILKPELGGAIVFDTLLLPEGLSDEERAVVSDAEGDGVLDERVLGKDGPGERRDGGDGGSGGRRRGGRGGCVRWRSRWRRRGNWGRRRLCHEHRGDERKGGEWGHSGRESVGGARGRARERLPIVGAEVAWIG